MPRMKKPGLGGGRVNSESLCKVKPNTQQWLVLEQLRQRPMSAAELQWSLPIADARAVVRDLIAKGYRIDKHPHPNPSEHGRPIQRYHLVESQ
ncbi:helix-turn-helix domain-containing protein [Billgrantia ethanolica]|uniref:Winged helix-turn-helix domain-containing protein n=1 Tax=Billgrantia ethanolica TaxID=2733486 RepID=A0ABS9A023_9GAMM|nr:helix-turn-helix domain-containing protein [Halomonas ethanolica]MCE8002158.1 hypothetical protein [Halomonas ethanolica]